MGPEVLRWRRFMRFKVGRKFNSFFSTQFIGIEMARQRGQGFNNLWRHRITTYYVVHSYVRMFNYIVEARLYLLPMKGRIIECQTINGVQQCDKRELE